MLAKVVASLGRRFTRGAAARSRTDGGGRRQSLRADEEACTTRPLAERLEADGERRYGSILAPVRFVQPGPRMLDRLGLAPRDVPTIQSAFTAARDTAWTQIRPLCAAAAGSAATADTLGLESCPQVILNAEKTTNPAAADSALRAVGAVKAGLADSSTIPASDPVGAAFLVLTGVAKDAENRLASVLGPEDARSAVYGNGSCGRTSEFTSAPGAPAQ